ncbi:MAG: phosphotransferase family protein [Acidimicrobiales bacterium]
MDRGRLATLVVVNRGGSLLGVTDPVLVALPWWQETGPLVDTVPGTTVLRLLAVEPDERGPMGGRATYLVEAGQAFDPIAAGLRPWPGSVDQVTAAAVAANLGPNPLRHPWARPGGPSADLRWVQSVIPITGQPRQHRSWNLSAIWSIPTDRGPVWLKCVPPFLAHEGTVLELLAGDATPDLIAADGHRLLLADMPGEDGYHAYEAEQLQMIETLVKIQAATVDRLDDFLDNGVPDLRAGPLAAELVKLVDRVAPNSRPLRELLDELPGRFESAAASGIPDALVHGDPHRGNCRRGVTPAVWFDWGDSFIGNPLLDVAALHRMAGPVADRWLALWEEAVPGSNPAAGWRALQPIAALRMAWVYQRFVDNIEPAERVYHCADVARVVADVEAMIS